MGGDNLVQLRRWERWTGDFPDGPDRRLRPRPAYSSAGARRIAGTPLRRPTPAAGRGAAAGRDAAAGLGLLRQPAASGSATANPRRAPTPCRAARDHERNDDGHRAEPRRGPRDGPRRGRRSSISSSTPSKTAMAEDIVTLDLAGKTAIADFMVIASGRSARQVAGACRASRSGAAAAGYGSRSRARRRPTGC